MNKLYPRFRGGTSRTPRSLHRTRGVRQGALELSNFSATNSSCLNSFSFACRLGTPGPSSAGTLRAPSPLRPCPALLPPSPCAHTWLPRTARNTHAPRAGQAQARGGWTGGWWRWPGKAGGKRQARRAGRRRQPPAPPAHTLHAAQGYTKSPKTGRQVWKAGSGAPLARTPHALPQPRPRPTRAPPRRGHRAAGGAHRPPEARVLRPAFRLPPSLYRGKRGGSVL